MKNITSLVLVLLIFLGSLGTTLKAQSEILKKLEEIVQYPLFFREHPIILILGKMERKVREP